MTLCTSCWACEEACPAGLSIKDLFLEWRENHPPTQWERHLRMLLRLATITPLGVRTLLPLFFLPLRGLKSRWKAPLPVTSIHPPKSFFFPGCFSRYAVPDAATSSYKRVLSLDSFKDVAVVPSGLCCGSALINNGLLKELPATATPFLEWLEKRNPLAVITADNTCGQTLRTLHHSLPSHLEKRWKRFAPRFQILQEIDPHFPPKEGFQSACHNEHRCDKPEATCCGFGGSFRWQHPSLSRRIGKRRLRHLGFHEGGDIRVEGPGCLAHLRRLVPPSQRARIRPWTD